MTTQQRVRECQFCMYLVVKQIIGWITALDAKSQRIHPLDTLNICTMLLCKSGNVHLTENISPAVGNSEDHQSQLASSTGGL